MTHQPFSFVLLLAIQIIAFPMSAQENKDCTTALELCGQSPFYFTPTLGVGTPDTDVAQTCVTIEFSSTWITWTVLQGGTLTFVLTPDSLDQDLDFVVFKYNTANDCEDKEVVRCMASGENVDAPPSSWEICTGATGLAVGETDTEEMPGCTAGDNNFLAPLETQLGEQYVMLINEFSSTGLGYTLSFGGDATLDCITVPTSEISYAVPESFNISPSLSSGLISIELQNEDLKGAQLIIYDMTGRVVYSEGSMDQMRHQVDLTGVSQGSYVVVLQKERARFARRFLLWD